ncbi:MAG: DUF885 domain-containing protein [Bacteroidetes bacterium]|jgi:uncharacterized protein (DUF885 family)|nr:DUF885 domain-containing protein [Bacteroidota bacterium]
MKKAFTFLSIILLMNACNTPPATTDNTEYNKNFDDYKNRFVEQMWAMYPMWATETGYHKYDSLLEINNADYRNHIIQFVNQHLDSLQSFDSTKLSDLNKMDAAIINNFLQLNKFNIEELKAWQWNPSSYNASGNISYMLSENYEPLENRIRNIGKKLEQVPAYYQAAKENIQNPSPEHLQLAIEQNKGGFESLQTTLKDSLGESTLSTDEKTNIVTYLNKAIAAVEDYVSFLKNLKNENGRSFRLGSELYAKKFNLEIESSYSYEQIYDSAMQRKNYLHIQMATIATKLWSKYFGNTPLPEDTLALISKVIDTISTNHVKPDEFQTTIEKQIPELEKFVTDHNLIYLDPSKPLKVRKEPAYMAGVAGASISAPGPYDKNGNTYYNVGSLAGWDAQRAESYLREYNNYTLQILNIHEAVPGHYTQLVYSNNSPSIIKAILGNGAMVEGWAVYGELMMLENGYGNNEPEMWLMYYKWNLRTVCNTLLDVSVHTRNMTHDEAMHLLTKEAFQQNAEAEGKWRRVMLTNVQLTSYYTGFKEICDLREECKKIQGNKFDLKKFHEKFLSFGSAPVKLIRAQMLSDLKQQK